MNVLSLNKPIEFVMRLNGAVLSKPTLFVFIRIPDSVLIDHQIYNNLIFSKIDSSSIHPQKPALERYQIYEGRSKAETVLGWDGMLEGNGDVMSVRWDRPQKATMIRTF